MRPELSDRQEKVLSYIVRCIEDEGYPPTVRQIMRHLDLRSPRSITQHLEALERKGYLRLVGTARGIQLADGVMPEDEGTPIVGRVAAGTPILAEENIVGHLPLTQEFGPRKGVFALRVQGDSMKDEGILDGDYVLVKHLQRVEQGDIAVVATSDGATVKRVHDEGDMVRLQPSNGGMQPTYVSKEDPNFAVTGKVIALVRMF